MTIVGSRCGGQEKGNRQGHLECPEDRVQILTEYGRWPHGRIRPEGDRQGGHPQVHPDDQAWQVSTRTTRGLNRPGCDGFCAACRRNWSFLA